MQPHLTPAEPPPPVSPPAIRRTRARRLAIFLALLGLGAFGYVWHRGGRVDDRTYGVADLERGPVSQIISWDDGRTAVQISRLSTLPADDLWRVATDQGRFDEFMPYVRKTTVTPGPAGTLIEKQWLDLPHASYELELRITLDESGNRRSARWEQTQGTLSYNQGAWIVEDHGDRAILRYQVSAALSGIPQFIVNFAMRRRLGRLLEAVEARTRDLQTREPDGFRSGNESPSATNP